MRVKRTNWRLFAWLLVLPVSIAGLIICGIGLSMWLQLQGVAALAVTATFASACYVFMAWAVAGGALGRESTTVGQACPTDGSSSANP